MPVFAYTAKSRDGKKTTGQIDAQDRKSALSAIQRKGLVPISVMQKSGGKSSSAKDDSKKDSSTKKKNKGSAFKLSLPNYMSPVETLHFTSEICDLLESGMTLGNALNCLAAREGESEGVTDIVTGLRDAIIEGYTFSDALEKYPKVFSNIYTNMIRAGEASGAMTDVLHRLVDHFESQQAMRSKIKTAMFYPTIVLIMAVGVTIFAITYLLPKFKTIFDQLGPDGLPPMTKALMGMSDFARNYGLIILLLLAVAGVALVQWIKTPSGKRKWDFLKLKMPLVKGIVAAGTFANFARTLQSLLSNGVPVIQALQITAQAVGNSVISEQLLRARDRVTDGTSISGPLAEGDIFPQVAIDMIAIGERTGDMPSALGHVAKRFEAELDRNVARFTSALEPIMIFIVAIIIAVIAISIIQAVMAVSSSANM